MDQNSFIAIGIFSIICVICIAVIAVSLVKQNIELRSKISEKSKSLYETYLTALSNNLPLLNTDCKFSQNGAAEYARKMENENERLKIIIDLHGIKISKYGNIQKTKECPWDFYEYAKLEELKKFHRKLEIEAENIKRKMDELWRKENENGLKKSGVSGVIKDDSTIITGKNESEIILKLCNELNSLKDFKKSIIKDLEFYSLQFKNVENNIITFNEANSCFDKFIISLKQNEANSQDVTINTNRGVK